MGNARYYYVYNVGAGNKTIFRNARDYDRFITKVKDYAQKEDRVRIIAYCLTGNAYHLIIEEKIVGATAQLLHRLSVAYAMYFNARYKELGHLFRGPYKEEQIANDDELVDAVSKLFAIPAGLRQKPQTYRWSAYPDYIAGGETWLYTAPLAKYFEGSDLAEALAARIEQQINQSPADEV